MKNGLLIGSWVVVSVFTVISCKNTFDEDEFRQHQAELKAANDSIAQKQNADALARASRLTEFKVHVMENTSPVPGVSVVIKNLSDHTLSQPGITDESGAVSFKDQVVIGKSEISISKEGYATANFEIDLGTVELHKNYEMMASSNVDGGTLEKVVPIPQTGKAVVPIFALSGSNSSAMIKGKATIETDLTNTTPEIPQNVQLRAEFNLSSALAQRFFPSNGNGLTNIITSYSIVGDSTSGRVNNSTGEFALVVPASAIGMDLPIRVSAQEFITNQIMYVNYAEDASVHAPFKNTEVKTTFILGDTAQSIPVVSGAYAVFNSPATIPGKGFTCDFESIPRLLDGGLVTGPALVQLGNTSYQLTNPGLYSSVPDITVSGEGTTATANAQMSFYVSTFTVTNAGSGYAPNSTATINIAYAVPGGNYIANSFDVTVTASGTLPAVISIPDIDGSSAVLPALTDQDYKPLNFNLTVTSDSPPAVPATVEGTFVAKVVGVKINPGTTMYSTAPTFTFSGGGATAQAEMKVMDFKNQYYVHLNNNAITSPYRVMPQDIQFVFPDTPMSSSITNNKVDYESDGTVVATNQSFILSLATDGNSLSSALSQVNFRTSTFWNAPPTLVITDDTPQQAAATITFNGNTISGLTNVSSGNGYDEPISLQIKTPEGTSGSGAAIDISDFVFNNPGTREYTWNGKCAMITGGGGYVANLNQQVVVNPTSLSDLSIRPKPGQVYTLNVNFGTGSKRSPEIH